MGNPGTHSLLCPTLVPLLVVLLVILRSALDFCFKTSLGEVRSSLSETATCIGIKASWSFMNLNSSFPIKKHSIVGSVSLCIIFISFKALNAFEFPSFNLALGCLCHEPSKLKSNCSVSGNILASVPTFFLFIIFVNRRLLGSIENANLTAAYPPYNSRVVFH